MPSPPAPLPEGEVGLLGSPLRNSAQPAATAPSQAEAAEAESAAHRRPAQHWFPKRVPWVRLGRMAAEWSGSERPGAEAVEQSARKQPESTRPAPQSARQRHRRCRSGQAWGLPFPAGEVEPGFVALRPEWTRPEWTRPERPALAPAGAPDWPPAPGQVPRGAARSPAGSHPPRRNGPAAPLPAGRGPRGPLGRPGRRPRAAPAPPSQRGPERRPTFPA